MSNIGICEFCKYKNTDITQDPCLGCSVEMEAFELDLSEHDKQIRADAFEEVLSIINAIINGVHQEFKKNGDMVNLGVICELQRFRDKLKEQKK